MRARETRCHAGSQRTGVSACMLKNAQKVKTRVKPPKQAELRATDSSSFQGALWPSQDCDGLRRPFKLLPQNSFVLCPVLNPKTLTETLNPKVWRLAVYCEAPF